MGWRFRNRSDGEFDEEIGLHLRLLAERFVEQGMSPGEAEAAARRQFGNRTHLKEVRMEMQSFAWLDSVARDIRYGLRALRRSPGFTAAAVVLLSLGIGANTAIFSVLDRLLLRSLPVRQPEQLAVLKLIPSSRKIQFPAGMLSLLEFLGPDPGFSHPLYTALRDSNEVFSGLLADYRLLPTDLSLRGDSSTPLEAQVDPVSGNYFATLGVRPVLGRLFTSADDQVLGSGGQEGPAAVLSYRLWRRRFGMDPSAVGRIIQIRGRPFTVVGVAAAGFDGEYPGTPADVWTPLSLLPALSPGLRLDDVGFMLAGRLKPGVTRRQAQAAMQSLLARIPGRNAFFGFTGEHFSIQVEDGRQGVSRLRARFAPSLIIVMSAVGLVLLIACANLATLLLARAAVRRREVAVRLSLGAGRGRLIRQFLTESLLLAAIGGAGGVFLARWGANLLAALIAGSGSDALAGVGPDWRILAFAMIITLLAGLLFGLTPALHSTRLKGGTDFNGSPGSLREWTRGGRSAVRWLVAAQIALSAVLLTGASLFARTMRNFEAFDVGFNREHTLLVTFDLSGSGYRGAKLADLAADFERRIRALPGVVATSAMAATPFGPPFGGTPIQVPGYTPAANDPHFTSSNDVGVDFFRASGIPLLRGREFGPQEKEPVSGASDDSTAPLTAVVNEAFARKFFSGRDPVGQRFTIRRGTPVEIVGLAGDAKYKSLREPTEPLIYFCSAQNPSAWRRLNIVVRFTGPSPYAPSLMSAIRAELSRATAAVRIGSMQTMQNLVDRSLVEEHMASNLSGLAGGLALLIVCIGLYGTVSYAAARRTREMGIRAALGASRQEICRMVLRETLATVAGGILLGLPAAMAAARLIAGRLFGVSAADPFSLTAMAAVIALVSLAAAFVPAWRAGRADPMAALRYE